MGARAALLVVDDSSTDRLRIVRLLERLTPRARIVQAADATTAIAAIEAEPFCALITDQHMGAVSGLDLLERVRGQCPGMRRIMVTADQDLNLVKEALIRGRVQGYLLKSWGLERTREVLRDLLPPEAFNN